MTKQHNGNTLIKLFKSTEEFVTKINFFDPKNTDLENPYYLRKNQILESRQDKSDIQTSKKILIF